MLAAAKSCLFTTSFAGLARQARQRPSLSSVAGSVCGSANVPSCGPGAWCTYYIVPLSLLCPTSGSSRSDLGYSNVSAPPRSSTGLHPETAGRYSTAHSASRDGDTLSLRWRSTTRGRPMSMQQRAKSLGWNEFFFCARSLASTTVPTIVPLCKPCCLPPIPQDCGDLS